jgi:beta-phosphoglucomutase-like phosphatase (HAD superfamily)
MTSQGSAILFDWDGTLLDSEPSTTAAWQLVLDELGYDSSNEFASGLFRLGWPAAYVRLAERWPVPDQQQLLGRLAQVRQGLPPARLFDDVPATITGLRRLGVTIALVTNSSHGRLASEMRRLPIHATDFAAIVTADMAGRAKPAPDPYLHAMALLGRPARVLAVEDSPAGVVSATTAGIAVLLVDRTGRAAAGTATTISRLDPGEIMALLAAMFTS